LGCQFNTVKGWVFEPSQYEENHPLKNYILKCMELKNNSVKGSLQYQTSKLLMNSIIGKFMQRNPVYSIEDTLDLLKTLDFDFKAVQNYLSKQKTHQSLKRPQLVSPNWSPEWGSLILGRARAIIGDFMNVSIALTGHTDSVVIKKGSSLNCKSLSLLKTLGSDIEHQKEYDGTSFWICRSSVYSPMLNDVAVKPTHHGYPVNKDRDFGKIIEHNLTHEEKINECSKIHIVTPKEFLRYGKPLGSHEIKTYKISWKWDDKRVLLEPLQELWSKCSETRPWKNIPELIGVLGLDKKKGRNKIDESEVSEWKEKHERGLSYYTIAKEHHRSPSTISKYLLQ